MRIIDNQFPITPNHINADTHLWDAFNHSETEVSAGWIVRMLQHRGKGWEPFTLSEIEKFYSQKHKNGFTFNKLITHGWIVEHDGQFFVTDEFVCRCLVSSPRVGEVSK